MKQVRWGIIGLGNIALKFAEGFQYTKNAELFRVWSNSPPVMLALISIVVYKDSESI